MAVEANKGFVEMDITKQRGIIETMAAAQLTAETANIVDIPE